ncbi:MAG: hypothetical protein D6732_12700 [Methanobacteriota archaeon]|nr:MAG: hypothetical protein D6732_12700 [Euryarchaeota archaeon]
MNEWERLLQFLQGKYSSVKHDLPLFIEQMTIQAFVAIHPIMRPRQWVTLHLQPSEINQLARKLDKKRSKLQEYIRMRLWTAVQLSKIDPASVRYDMAFPQTIQSEKSNPVGKEISVSIHAEIAGVLESLTKAIGVEIETLLWTALLSSMPKFFIETEYDYQIVIGLDILEHAWLEQIATKFGIEVKTDVLKHIILI